MHLGNRTVSQCWIDVDGTVEDREGSSTDNRPKYENYEIFPNGNRYHSWNSNLS